MSQEGKAQGWEGRLAPADVSAIQRAEVNHPS
jgi:hypothetical protein